MYCSQGASLFVEEALLNFKIIKELKNGDYLSLYSKGVSDIPVQTPCLICSVFYFTATP